MFLFRLAMHSSKQVDVAQNIGNMENQLYNMHYGENYKNPAQLTSFASNLTKFYNALTPQNPDYAQGMAFCSAAFNWLKGAAQYSGIELELPDPSKIVSSAPKGSDFDSFSSHYSNFLSVCSQFAGSRRSREGIDMLTRALDEISQYGETTRKRVLILDDSGKAQEFISSLQSLSGVQFSITTESGERYNKGAQKVAVVFTGVKTESAPIETQTEFMVPRENDFRFDATGSRIDTRHRETETKELAGTRKTKEITQSTVADLYLAYNNVATNPASLEQIGLIVDDSFRELAYKMGFKGEDAIDEFLKSPKGSAFRDELERRIGNGTFRIVSSASTEYIGNVADYEKQIQNAIDRGHMASQFINARLVDAGLSSLDIPTLPNLSLLQEIPEGERQRLINSSSTSEGLKDFLQNRYNDEDVKQQRQAVFGFIYQAAQEGDSKAAVAWEKLTGGRNPAIIANIGENGEMQYDIGNVGNLNTLLSLKRGVLRTKGSILEEALSERNSRSVKFEIAYSISNVVPDLKPADVPYKRVPIEPIKIKPPKVDIPMEVRSPDYTPKIDLPFIASELAFFADAQFDPISIESYFGTAQEYNNWTSRLWSAQTVAEKTQAVNELSQWVFGNAQNQLGTWRDMMVGATPEEQAANLRTFFTQWANGNAVEAKALVNPDTPFANSMLEKKVLSFIDMEDVLRKASYDVKTYKLAFDVELLKSKKASTKIYVAYANSTLYVLDQGGYDIVKNSLNATLLQTFNVKSKDGMAKEFDKMSSKLNIDLFATAGVSFVWLDTTKSKGTGIFDFTPSENYHGFNASLGAIIEQQLAEKTKLTFTPELSAQHYSDDRVGQQSTTFSFNLKNNLKVGRWDFSVDPRFRKMYLTSQALDFKNSSKKDIYDVSAGIKFQPTEKLELGIGGNLMWMEGQKMVPAGSLSISYYPWKSTDVDAEVEYKRKR